MPIPLGILAVAGAGAGVASDFDLLATQVLSQEAATVTFSGLDSYTDYKHLQLRMTARTTRPAVTDEVAFTFNGDSGTYYSKHRLGANGSSVSTRSLTSQGNVELEFFSGDTNATDSYTGGILDILDFSSTTKNTTIRFFDGVPGSTFWVSLQSGLYYKTDAITSFTLDPITGSGFLASSRFSLYGVK